MINSYASTAQTVASGGNVIFNTDRVRTGSCLCGGWLSHTNPSDTFTLTKGVAVYEVSYNAIISSASTGVASLAIQSNGVEVVGSESQVQIGTANDVGTATASVLVKVPFGEVAVITLNNNSSLSLTVTDPNIVFKRLG